MEVNKWTDEEVENLKMYYPNKDITLEELHEKYIQNHTIKNIVGKANSIGLLRKPKPKEWTDEEIKILTDNYFKYSVRVLIEEFFPYRSKCQIEKKGKGIRFKYR